MKSFCSILLMVLLTLTPYPKSEVTANEGAKEVLILHSYNYGFDWLEGIDQGLKDVLNSTETNLYVEYLNDYQMADRTTFDEIEDYLTIKFNHVDFDCILVVDNYAFEFLRERYETFAGEVPVVFVGINGYEATMLFTENMTGIAQTIEANNILDLMMAHREGYKDVVVLASTSETAYAEVQVYRNLFESDYSDLQVSYIHVDSISEGIAAVESLTESQIIMATNLVNDDGSILRSNDTLALIYDAAHLPIYTANLLHMSDGSHGALGGFVNDPYDHGYEAARLVHRILNGEPVQDIPVVTRSLGKYVFNYSLMQKFGIGEEDVPHGSMILGKPSNQIILNRSVAVSGFILLVVAVIFIFALVFIIRMKIRDQHEILKAHQKLDEYNDILRDRNRELMVKNDEIMLLVNKDPITSFYNRNRFEEQVVSLYESNKAFSIYGVAVKNLAEVDEAYGYGIGDQVRYYVGKIIREIAGENSIFYGRHHNYYYIADDGSEAYDRMDGKSTSLLNAVNRTVTIEDKEIQITAGVGMVKRLDTGEESNALNLLDMALAETIRIGSGNVIPYSESFRRLIRKRLSLEVKLKKAIQEKEFELYLQPQIDGMEGHIIGAEALIRWPTEFGFISPGEFIPFAEEHGFIERIGDWVIDEIMVIIADLRKKGIHIPISINVSVRQLNEKLLDRMKRLIGEKKLLPTDFTIEITETYLMENIEEKIRILESLSRLGICISLDDFGTGYSSMKYIQTMPIDELKLDKDFIADIEVSKKQSLIRSMISIGHELALKVVAEGVETDEQLELLRSMEVDILQGWYYARAMPVTDFVDYYNDSLLSRAK